MGKWRMERQIDGEMIFFSGLSPLTANYMSWAEWWGLGRALWQWPIFEQALKCDFLFPAVTTTAARESIIALRSSTDSYNRNNIIMLNFLQLTSAGCGGFAGGARSSAFIFFHRRLSLSRMVGASVLQAWSLIEVQAKGNASRAWKLISKFLTF